MTILIAATLSNCAVLIADSRQSNITAATTTAVTKIRSLTPNLVAAKFGYAGPEGDAIWEQISALDPELLNDVPQLLPQVSELGRPIYEERRDWAAAHGIGDYGYTLMFASFDEKRGSGIHYIDWKMDEGVPISRFYKDGGPQVVAQGPAGSQPKATASIQQAMQAVGDQTRVLVNRWAYDAVRWSASVDETCALPADICMVDVTGVRGPWRITGEETDLGALSVSL